jgi:hypothetical protein
VLSEDFLWALNGFKLLFYKGNYIFKAGRLNGEALGWR